MISLLGLHPTRLDLTCVICTLWWRAPENLLLYKKYSYAVDNWAVGAVIAQMIAGKAIFSGSNELEVLTKIFRLLGTPTDETWPGVSAQIRKLGFTLAHYDKPTLDDKEYNIPLVSGLLTLNPDNRLTAREALNMDIFDDVRDYIENKYPAPQKYLSRIVMRYYYFEKN